MRHVNIDGKPSAFYQNEADLIAIINQHRREEDERWRATDRTDRIMVREVTITRFLLATMLLIYALDTIVL